MLDVRNSLSKEALDHLSNIIQDKVLALDEFRKAECVGVYYSIGSEVSTRKIIEHAMKSKIVALPKIDNSTLIFASIKSIDDLKIGRYNIMEPNGECIVKPDLILVPGIAFDSRGYRIGYGKGYYDKYLASNDSYSIGLAYDFQILRSIPYDKHDVKMNKIVTDKQILTII